MTVSEIRELLEGLPDDMVVIMPAGDNTLLAVCRGRSGVQNVEYPDTPSEKYLILYPCTCNDESEGNDFGEINLN